jgi:S-adenosylmethionine decarboxylase proenzyme
MICDLCNIQHMDRLESMESMMFLFDRICQTYSFEILGKLPHHFSPQGMSLIYMLSESHISIHTFPEKQYAAVDIYTCREYPDNSVYETISRELTQWFDCECQPVIMNRGEPGKTHLPQSELYH